MNYLTSNTVIVGIGITSCMYAAYVVLRKYLKKYKKPETLDEVLRKTYLKRLELKKRNSRWLFESNDAPSLLLKQEVELDFLFFKYAWNSLRLEDEKIDNKSIERVLEASHYAEKHFKIGQIEEIHVRGIHGYLMYESNMAGQLRNHDVSVSGVNYERFPPPHEEVPRLLNEFISWLNSHQSSNSPETIIEIAATAYLKFITIHPFLIGNGLSARALFNGLVRQWGYPWVAIKSKSTDKFEYYQSIQHYFKNGDVAPFCLYMARRVDSALDQLLKLKSVS